MKKDRSAFRAGLFIVISIALCVVVIVSIKGVSSLFDKKSQHHVAFKLGDDLSGLRVGDSVRLGGFPVGTVDRIEPMNVDQSTQNEPQLLLTFSMPHRYVLREDASMGMQSTLTGTAWLNIDSLGKGSTAAEKYVFAGKPNPISAIFASMAAVMPDVQQVASDVRFKTLPGINSTVADAATVVKIVREKADPISERAVDMLTQIRDFFGDTKGDWKAAITSLRQTMASAKEKMPGILDKADATMEKSREAVTHLKDTAANTKDITGSVKEMLQRNRTRIDAIIAGLKTSSDNIKGATAEIRRAPWRILYKPSRDEMNNWMLFDATRQFAEGANDLDDATTALRDAMQNPNLDPALAQKLMDELQHSFEKFKLVETKLWKEAK